MIPFLVLIAMLMVRPWGFSAPGKRSRGNKPWRTQAAISKKRCRALRPARKKMQKIALALAFMILLAYPLVASPFFLGLANQIFSRSSGRPH